MKNLKKILKETTQGILYSGLAGSWPLIMKGVIEDNKVLKYAGVSYFFISAGKVIYDCRIYNSK